MISVEFSGKVCLVGSVRNINKKDGSILAIQEYAVDVFEENTQYPSKLAFEVVGEDKIAQYGITENSIVKVKANLSSNIWQGKCYTSLRAWNVAVEKQGTVVPPQTPQQAAVNQPTRQAAPKVETKTESNVDTSDLPF